MTTARQTYAASVAAAVATKVVTDLQNELVRQESINAQRGVVGLQLQNGNSSLVTAIKNANTAKLNADLAAEMAKQAAIAVARDALRTAGGDSSAF
jgi:hypothetical protein